MRSSIAVIALIALPVQQACADGLLGLYLGGALGQGKIDERADYPAMLNPAPGEFEEKHLAFKAMAGFRPIPLIGAELDYYDFGHPHGTIFSYPATSSLKGPAAFGVLYLPVPVIDLYLKAGVAHLQSTLGGFHPVPYLAEICVSGTPCGTARFQLNRTNTSGAGGAGAQYKLGSWALRMEYERFNAAGGNPSMMSAGISWQFL